MKNSIRIAVLFLVFIGCAKNDKSDENSEKEAKKIASSDFVGTWESNILIDGENASEFFGGPPEAGISLGLEATEEFADDSKYNSEGQFTLNMDGQGTQINLKFDLKVQGNWKLKDSTLIITTEGGEISAADEATQTIISQIPVFAELTTELKPEKGSVSEYNILTLSKDAFQYKTEDLGEMLIDVKRR